MKCGTNFYITLFYTRIKTKYGNLKRLNIAALMTSYVSNGNDLKSRKTKLSFLWDLHRRSTLSLSCQIVLFGVSDAQFQSSIITEFHNEINKDNEDCLICRKIHFSLHN